MDWRIKTLHPKVYGGILERCDIDNAIIHEYDITPINMVVNLYPFAAAVIHADCTRKEAVENIDIGNPTIVRSAVKNYKDVAIIVNSADYPAVLTKMDSHSGLFTLET